MYPSALQSNESFTLFYVTEILTVKIESSLCTYVLNFIVCFYPADVLQTLSFFKIVL